MKIYTKIALILPITSLLFIGCNGSNSLANSSSNDISTRSIVSNGAEKIFDSKCLMCHLKEKPTDKSKVIAPAMMGVMRHVKMKYDNKDEAVNFIVDYVLNPSKDKALCMPKKIKRFGLMPSQKGNISKDELKSVANWVYDSF